MYKLSPSLLTAHDTLYDIKRLELYSNNMAVHHLITVLLPSLAKLVVTKQLGDGGYKRTAQSPRAVSDSNKTSQVYSANPWSP